MVHHPLCVLVHGERAVRIDRGQVVDVEFLNGETVIVDYKFGDKNSRYKAQVGKYAAIYRRLGFKDVTTAIWYVPSDVVE